MDFINHYFVEEGGTSIDRMRKRYSAKLSQDLHMAIDPCSWTEEKGGVYADVAKNVYEHLKSEMDGDLHSDPLSRYRITGNESDGYESKINVKSTKCADVFTGKGPEPEKKPEPEPESEKEPEPSGDGVDVQPMDPKDNIPEGNGKIDENRLFVRFKEDVVAIPFNNPWFKNPLDNIFELDGKKWYLIPMKYPTVLKSGKTIDTAVEVPTFIRNELAKNPKYGYKNNSPFVWVLKDILDGEIEKLTGEKGAESTGEQEPDAASGEISAKGENGPWIVKFTTKGNNPVDGYKIDINNPGIPPKIKDFVVKYRNKVNAERKKKDPKAAQDIGNVIFVVGDDMPKNAIPKDVAESMIIISRKMLDEVLKTCSAEYINETTYFMEFFGKKNKEENSGVRVGLNIVKAYTYKTKNGGKITFADCIYHSDKSANNKGEEPSGDNQEPQNDEDTDNEEGVDNKKETAAESFVRLYEASEEGEEPNIDPNVKNAEVATGQHKFIIGFDKNAVKWVTKICKKTPAQICAEGSFGPSWKSNAGKSGSGSGTKATYYSGAMKKDLYGVKVLVSPDKTRKDQFYNALARSVGGGIKGHSFKQVNTNMGDGYRFDVGGKGGYIYILYENLKNTKFAGYPEVWFIGNVTKDITLLKQALCVIAGISKEEPNKLPKEYKALDVDKENVINKSKVPIEEIREDEKQVPDDTKTQPGDAVDVTSIESGEIQKILNKIMDDGYDALTDEEKKTLEDYKKSNASDAEVLKLIDDVIATGKIEAKPEDNGTQTVTTQPSASTGALPTTSAANNAGASPTTSAANNAGASPTTSAAGASSTTSGNKVTFDDISAKDLSSFDVLFGPSNKGKIKLYFSNRFLTNNGIKKPTGEDFKTVPVPNPLPGTTSRQFYSVLTNMNWDDIVLNQGEKAEDVLQSTSSYTNKYIKNIISKLGGYFPVYISYQEQKYVAMRQSDDIETKDESFASFRDAMLETFKRGK